VLRQWPADAGRAQYAAASGQTDRLLIEPTGLGHPKQILDLLTAPVYEPWIDLRATLCLLDPRQLLDDKAVANENFRDQLASADVIVANKADRATAESQAALDAWWQHFGGNRTRVQTTQGILIAPCLTFLV
jgi:G3E family GTPase